VALHPFAGRTGRYAEGGHHIAVNVARDQARKDRKTYLVASTPLPNAAIYIFASDHPDARDPAINVMLELTPSGESIRRPGFRTSVRH
jgi:hypothetical protein